jgi:hypothetical protein
MAFVKRDVKDRVVQYPRRYQLVEVQPSIFDLIPVPGTITEPGTPINKAYLQPIEDGISDLGAEVNEHKVDYMPHQFIDGTTTYRWGLSVVDGVVTMNYEEVTD